MIAGQKTVPGRIHARRIVTVHAAAEVITIDLRGEDTRMVPRTTTQPARHIKAQQARKAAHASQAIWKCPPSGDTRHLRQLICDIRARSADD